MIFEIEIGWIIWIEWIIMRIDNKGIRVIDISKLGIIKMIDSYNNCLCNLMDNNIYKISLSYLNCIQDI